MRKMLIFLMLLLLVPAAAMAQPYFKGKVGFYFPKEDDFDTGPNFRVAYGVMLEDLSSRTPGRDPLLSNTAIEAEIGYYRSEFSERQTIFGQTFSTDADYWVVPITATALYIHPAVPEVVEVYGGAGLGLYIVDSEVRVSTPVLRIKEDETDLEVGLHLVGGGTYYLTPQVGLGAELEWALVSDDFGGVFLNFGLKYKF